MTPQDFVYWLQGFLELSECEGDTLALTENQVKCIQEHIALVLRRETSQAIAGVTGVF